MRLWKSCLRDRTRKGKYFSRKSIKALWWDRRGAGCLWPPVMEAPIPSRWTGITAQEILSAYFTASAAVLNLYLMLLLVTQKCVFQKKNGIRFQWIFPHTYSPGQGANVFAAWAQLCRVTGPAWGGEGRPAESAAASLVFPSTASDTRSVLARNGDQG